MTGHHLEDATPLPGRTKHASAKKSNMTKARVSSPSGLGHVEAQVLAAQPLEPARGTAASARAGASLTNESARLLLTSRRSPELPARP